MKIRNGFVSNSSSSSFIIKKQGEYYDTISIARKMLTDYFTEYASYNSGKHPQKDFILNELKQLRKNGDVNVSITFNSPNEDTYIVDLGYGYVYVRTCNNVNWTVEELRLKELPNVLKEKYGNSIDFPANWDVQLHEQYDSHEYDDSPNFEYRVKPEDCVEGIKYFKIDTGFFVQRTPVYKSCDTCYHEIFIIGGRELCLRCDENTIMRALKLEKFKKYFRKDE